jgi:uncharacterized protein (DUF1800 family)
MRGTGDLQGEDRALHVLNRLAFGPKPGDLEHVRSIGYERYIQEQLHPESIPLAPALSERLARMPTLRMTPVELFVEFMLPIRRAAKGDKQAKREARRRARLVLEQAAEARLVRALESPRQLEEVLTAFWFNHFNVFAAKGPCLVWTGSFEQEAIRPHVLGRFRTLLGATARHPAMLFYLDNWLNTAPGSPGARGRFDGINENYAREIMELHTLGVNGGYTQQDVVALAHILTGWGLAPLGRLARLNRMRRADFFRLGRERALARARQEILANGTGFHFDPRRHDFSPKIFLGRRIEGAGAAEVEHALDILASHPATARHLSFELARYFVADQPPPAMVSAMAERYLASGGDIRAVMLTMLERPEFFARPYARNKFRTPYEYVIAAVRATGVRVTNFRPMAGMMRMLGMPLYGCQTPNGYAQTEQAWLNPDAMMMRLSFATALGTGHLPLERPEFEEVADQEAGGGGAMQMRGAGRLFARNHAPQTGFVEKRAKRDAPMTPPDAPRLMVTLGNAFSAETSRAIASAPERLRAALVLGSPAMMMR